VVEGVYLYTLFCSKPLKQRNNCIGNQLILKPEREKELTYIILADAIYRCFKRTIGWIIWRKYTSEIVITIGSRPLSLGFVRYIGKMREW
jgi:hypothetical protein